MKRKLVIFDLDNTILNGDSDYSWINFLINENYVDKQEYELSLIHISEPTRLRRISYAVFCLKKKKQQNKHIYHITIHQYI